MTDVRDPASRIDAAQKAVGDGDYLEAERLLREAAAIQEATLGESHPDVATTLNNLAFVCERTGKFDEAERGYRRAHKIAVASLSPGHPFIKTSLSNLMDFCEVRGIPIWTRPERPVEDEPLPDDGDVEPLHEDADVEPPVIDVPAHLGREPVAASRLPLRALGALALVAAAIVVITFARQGQGTTSVAPAVLHVPTEVVPVATPDPSSAATVPPRPEPASDPAPAAVVARKPAAPTPRREPANVSASVTVLTAQLCSALEKRGSPDWRCTPAVGDLRPGTYRFYTRLRAASATGVEHRWYFNGRVHQTMRLSVPASQGNGYRTFSSNSVSAERGGEWKVELRAPDGTVLDEKSFRVR